MKHLLLFALIALLVSSECVLNQAARGQSFTPVSYNFGSNVDSIADGSWATNVTLDCLASNGFGQRTASALSGGASRNFLLGNKLVAAGVTQAQAGVIAHNAFSLGDPPSGTDVVKVAANVGGNVRYVICIVVQRQTRYG